MIKVMLKLKNTADLLPLEVIVEEISIEQSLHKTSNPSWKGFKKQAETEHYKLMKWEVKRFKATEEERYHYLSSEYSVVQWSIDKPSSKCRKIGMHCTKTSIISAQIPV